MRFLPPRMPGPWPHRGRNELARFFGVLVGNDRIFADVDDALGRSSHVLDATISRSVVRGVFPEEWRRERELREELALLDTRTIDGLWRA